MTEHVPNDLLHAFVKGDVEEQLAIHVAEHFDSCPHCATRAATLEPLASAFASCDDPLVPEHLATAVLEELARQPHGRAVPEVAVGAVLLVLAAALAAATQHPVTLLADVGSMVSAASAVVRGAALGLTSYALASSAAMVMAGIGAAFTLHIAQTPHVVSPGASAEGAP